MRATGLLPWERLLLVAALVVGVLAMHATPVLCPGDPAGSTAPAAVTHDHAATVPVAEQDRGADCGAHHALAACLAILGGGILMVALRLLLRQVSLAAAPGRRAVSAVASSDARPPPRTSLRLAQLCVSRR